MYSWDGDTSNWHGAGQYAYTGNAQRRKATAAQAQAAGPRNYTRKSAPNEKVTDAKKHVSTTSTNPIIVMVDVTGSMRHWPFEIFDRLPLLFNTLSSYREDAEICFMAVGDSLCDRWPLQVTSFASGFDLEQLLDSLYGEGGGGGNGGESYGLAAHWINTHVETPNAKEKPYLIVFGDEPIHKTVDKEHILTHMGDKPLRSVNAIRAWKKTARNWNTWFLRRPVSHYGDRPIEDWSRAVGANRIFDIDDEQRAVDYAMGIISAGWDKLGDFEQNMLARQPIEKVEALIGRIKDAT